MSFAFNKIQQLSSSSQSVEKPIPKDRVLDPGASRHDDDRGRSAPGRDRGVLVALEKSLEPLGGGGEASGRTHYCTFFVCFVFCFCLVCFECLIWMILDPLPFKRRSVAQN